MEKSYFKIENIFIGLVLIITFGIVMLGCQEEDLATTMADRQEKDEIASKYFELRNNQYMLNLSEREAISLGISKSDYNNMCEEISKANAFITEKINDGIEIILADPQKKQIDRSIVRLKVENEEEKNRKCLIFNEKIGTGPKAKLVPIGVTSVTIATTTQYALNVITGTVKNFGVEKAFVIIGGGSVTIDLAASNTSMTINMNQTCSCDSHYSAYYE